MTSRSWLDDEQRPLAYVRQAARLVMFGVKRPLAFVVTAALFAALVVGAAWFSKRSYAPSVVLRMVEADRAPTAMPAPRRQLAEFVRQGVFTSEPLLGLIRQYGLYPSLAKKNPRAALESFREDIEIEVYDNYFLEERPLGAAPRSARLSVSFRGPNPQVAVDVTRALAALIVDHEIAARRDQSARALDRAKREVDAAEQALARRRATIAESRAKGEQAPDREAFRRVELLGLLGSIPTLERQRDAAEQRAARLALGAALESRGLGMSFEIVDDGALSTATERRDKRIYLATISLILGLPLVAMAVGAFDPKRGLA
jgi:hypothetical protein